MRKPFECGECGAGFFNGSWIVKCTCCRLHFASAIEMKEHRHQNHLNELKCEVCHKIYSCGAEKRKHMRAKHSVQKRSTHYFECSKCGKVLCICAAILWLKTWLMSFLQTDFKVGKRALLDVHMANDCERILLFKCQICGAHFDSERSAKTHRLTHVNDELMCEVCYKVYPTLAQLVSHRTSHEDKMFTCEYCEKSFLRQVVYLKHLSAHTGINPFKCSKCSQRFLKSADRERERKTVVSKARKCVRDSYLVCFSS